MANYNPTKQECHWMGLLPFPNPSGWSTTHFELFDSLFNYLGKYPVFVYFSLKTSSRLEATKTKKKKNQRYKYSLKNAVSKVNFIGILSNPLLYKSNDHCVFNHMNQLFIRLI